MSFDDLKHRRAFVIQQANTQDRDHMESHAPEHELADNRTSATVQRKLKGALHGRSEPQVVQRYLYYKTGEWLAKVTGDEVRFGQELIEQQTNAELQEAVIRACCEHAPLRSSNPTFDGLFVILKAAASGGCKIFVPLDTKKSSDFCTGLLRVAELLPARDAGKPPEDKSNLKLAPKRPGQTTKLKLAPRRIAVKKDKVISVFDSRHMLVMAADKTAHKTILEKGSPDRIACMTFLKPGQKVIPYDDRKPMLLFDDRTIYVHHHASVDAQSSEWSAEKKEQLMAGDAHEPYERWKKDYKPGTSAKTSHNEIIVTLNKGMAIGVAAVWPPQFPLSKVQTEIVGFLKEYADSLSLPAYVYRPGGKPQFYTLADFANLTESE